MSAWHLMPRATLRKLIQTLAAGNPARLRNELAKLRTERTVQASVLVRMDQAIEDCEVALGECRA